MRSIIRQSVELPASADRLFDMYLDPVAHGAFTGSAVTIAAKAGTAFQAFGGQLSGTMLVVVRPRLVVQSWRSTKFTEADPDSTLILLFSPDESDPAHGRIDLVHLDVPEHDCHGVTEGWQKFYWTPWQAYLSAAKG